MSILLSIISKYYLFGIVIFLLCVITMGNHFKLLMSLKKNQIKIEHMALPPHESDYDTPEVKSPKPRDK